MPIEQIIIRSISGYIFVVPGIILYFLHLKKSNKKQSLFHIAAAFVFCYYLIGIWTATGIHQFNSFSPRIVLIPFLDMISGPVDTILNIVLFLPLGFFLPLLYQHYGHISQVAFAGFLLSLSIELVQMFGMGATDINDLITNTVGTLLGFSIYKFFLKLIGKESCEKFRVIVVNGYKESLFFILYSFAVMVTVQPFVISSLFQLG